MCGGSDRKRELELEGCCRAGEARAHDYREWAKTGGSVEGMSLAVSASTTLLFLLHFHKSLILYWVYIFSSFDTQWNQK